MSHTIRLSVPTDYTLPAFYVNADARTVSLALTLGAEAYETLHEKTVQTVRKETHSDIMKSAAEGYKKEVELVQGELQQQLKRIRHEKTRAEEACAAATARLE